MKLLKREPKRLHKIMTVDEMQITFMSERGTINAVFILRRLQEEYHANEKIYICMYSRHRESY